MGKYGGLVGSRSAAHKTKQGEVGRSFVGYARHAPTEEEAEVFAWAARLWSAIILREPKAPPAVQLDHLRSEVARMEAKHPEQEEIFRAVMKVATEGLK